MCLSVRGERYTQKKSVGLEVVDRVCRGGDRWIDLTARSSHHRYRQTPQSTPFPLLGPKRAHTHYPRLALRVYTRSLSSMEKRHPKSTSSGFWRSRRPSYVPVSPIHQPNPTSHIHHTRQSSQVNQPANPPHSLPQTTRNQNVRTSGLGRLYYLDGAHLHQVQCRQQLRHLLGLGFYTYMYVHVYADRRMRRPHPTEINSNTPQTTPPHPKTDLVVGEEAAVGLEPALLPAAVPRLLLQVPADRHDVPRHAARVCQCNRLCACN